ncbi:helix-turn-helix domain-containing protein [Parasphingorhabdus sp.]|uniref:helix-turn-helix domain-containing protein n=1 Tax=Parasphingorhabdus sp. TaxID=2709688 RepID=UPI003D2B27DF
MSEWPIDWRALVDEAIRRRKREGLSQRSLAALAGVSTPTVNAFEQGEINLRFERIVAILDTLGLFVQPGKSDSLQSFVHEARRRWQELVANLPEGNTARQPFGYSEQAYAIGGVDKFPTLSKLQKILADAPKTSGWTPFWVPSRASLKPAIRDGLIECWLGKPDTDRMFGDAAHSDFWQVARDGSAYLQRGYQEDGPDHEPGTIFDLTLPIWRTAEVLLHAGWLAKKLRAEPKDKIQFFARYDGLAGRELLSWAKPLLRLAIDGRFRARSSNVDLKIDTTVEQIDENLPAVVHEILLPLYERFDGFIPPAELVNGQIDELRRSSQR